MLRTIRDGLFLLGLAVAMVAVPVGSAQAAFPGKAGPLVYSRGSADESADVCGLVLHGPRQKQKPHPLTTNQGDDTPSFSADGRLVDVQATTEREPFHRNPLGKERVAEGDPGDRLRNPSLAR